MSRGEWRSLAGLAAWQQQLVAWTKAARLVPGDATTPTIAEAQGSLGTHTQRSPRLSSVLDAVVAQLCLLGALVPFYGSPAFRHARFTVRVWWGDGEAPLWVGALGTRLTGSGSGRGLWCVAWPPGAHA